MKILLVNDTENDYHFGCTGTSRAVKKYLLQKGVLSPKTYTVIDSWSINPSPSNISDFDKDEFFLKWQENNVKLEKDILVNDVICCTGEGTISGFEGRKAAQNLLYLMYISKVRYGKKTIIINHSCFPDMNNYNIDINNEAYKIYQKVYETLDYCAVRDELSFSILKQLGVKVEQAFDCLPLYIKELYKETAKPLKLPQNYILLNGGSTFYKTFHKFIKKDLWKIQAAKKNKVFFLFSQTGRVADDDLQCIAFIKKYNKKLSTKILRRQIGIIEVTSVDEWLTTIKNAKMLISGRFHHSIAARVFGTPFEVFDGNTPKNNVFKEKHTLEEIMLLAQKNFIWEKVNKKALSR